MSNPRVDPHPDKWLSVTKALKPATQRPLVSSSFRAHAGIATPPTTTRKNASNATNSASGSALRKRRVSEVTPTAPLATRNIQSYLTPPTSNTQPTKRLRASSKLKNAPHLHQSPTRRSPRLHRNRERDREDEIRQRSRSLELWRATVPPPVLSPVKRLRKVASPSPAPSLETVEPRVQTEHKPSHHEAGARPTTQHQANRERKRLRVDSQEGSHENTHTGAIDSKQKRALGDFKSLVHHSSERSSSPRSSSPTERVPLASKNANVLRRHSSAVVEPVCARDSQWPKRQPVPRTPAIPSAFPARSQIIPTAFPSRLRNTPAESSQPPSSTTPRARRIAHHNVTPPKSRTAQRRDQQETLFELPPAPPRQPVFKPVSPKPISGWCPVEMQAETLMTWSMGGGASTLGPEPALQDEIEQVLDDLPAPVWENEDVIDDDEGDEVGSRVSVEDVGSPQMPETIPSQLFPNLVGTSSSPARPPQESHLASSPPEPIESADEPGALGGPDVGTQGVTCSPSPRRTHGRVHPPSSPPRLSLTPLSPAAESPSKPGAKPLVRHSKQDLAKRRRDMDHALFSSLSEASQVKPAPRVPLFPHSTYTRKSPQPVKSQSRKVPPSRTSQAKKAGRPSKSQSKLDAFGYSRSSARVTREFDTCFSDEEDLEFGDVDRLSPIPVSGNLELRPVPFAPPHPSLRPMGIREQARRDSAAMERHRGQRESLSSSDQSSSLPELPPSATTDGSSSQSDERLEAKVSESTRAWWDGLGQDESWDG